MNKYLLKATTVGALGGLLFGFDTAVIAGTTEQLTAVFHPDAVHAWADGVYRAGGDGDRGVVLGRPWPEDRRA